MTDYAAAKAAAYAAKIRPWPHPVIASAHIDCTMCSWAYAPNLGGTDTPMVVKHANAMCRHAVKGAHGDAGSDIPEPTERDLLKMIASTCADD